MSDIIDRTHLLKVSAAEHGISQFRSKLEYINWLFGVSSAVLFGCVASTYQIDPGSHHSYEYFSVMSAGLFAFLGILVTFKAKAFGYDAIENQRLLISFIDMQGIMMSDMDLEDDHNSEVFLKMTGFGYLTEAMKLEAARARDLCQRNFERMDLFVQFQAYFVLVALMFLLVLLFQRAILNV